MKRRQFIYASGAICAVVFMTSAVLGDGIFQKGEATKAAAQDVEAKWELLSELEQIKWKAAMSEEATLPEVLIQSEQTGWQGRVDLLTAAKNTAKTDEDDAQAEEKQESKTEEDSKESSESKSSETKEKTQIDYVIADVSTSLNIRKKASTESEIVGKLYRGAKATIVKRGKKWTKIKSGSVKGYVANEYLLFDEEAEKGAEKFGVKIATVETETLRIRKKPGTDAAVLDLAAEGETFLVADKKNSDKDSDWVAIQYSKDVVGYVSAEYVSISLELEEAISIEEEKRLLEEKKKKEEAAQAAQNSSSSNTSGNKAGAVATTARGSVAVSADDAYLMAVIVYLEAGNQSYEGKLAVANVIINRLLSGKWGNTVSSVIYAPGQFYSADSKRLKQGMQKGPTSSCVNAVADALAGNNNIGNYMSFCATWAANYSSYSSYTIIGGHCFH